MNTFRSEQQRDTVLKILARELGRPGASERFRARYGVFSNPFRSPEAKAAHEDADRLDQLLEVVCQSRSVSIGHVLAVLEPQHVVALGSLLVSLANGHDDIDEWIAMFETKGTR